MFSRLKNTVQQIVSSGIPGILLLAAICYGCESGETDNFPVDEVFPDCRLTEIDLNVSYGVNQKTIFEYEDDQLARRLFYSNGIFRSEKLFDYNEKGEIRSMYEYDSTSNENRMIASYEYENGQIKNFIHYNNYDSSIIQTLTFHYTDKHLRRMITENPGGKYEFEINTDGKGNVIYRKLDKVNEKDTETLFETFFEMDDKLNPLYRMPDFFSSFAFFNQNNIIRIQNVVEGQDTTEFIYSNIYHENKLLKSEFHKASSGTHNKNFIYECF